MVVHSVGRLQAACRLDVACFTESYVCRHLEEVLLSGAAWSGEGLRSQLEPLGVSRQRSASREGVVLAPTERMSDAPATAVVKFHAGAKCLGVIGRRW